MRGTWVVAAAGGARTAEPEHRGAVPRGSTRGGRREDGGGEGAGDGPESGRCRRGAAGAIPEVRRAAGNAGFCLYRLCGSIGSSRGKTGGDYPNVKAEE